jgi:hypothetical protein
MVTSRSTRLALSVEASTSPTRFSATYRPDSEPPWAAKVMLTCGVRITRSSTLSPIACVWPHTHPNTEVGDGRPHHRDVKPPF